MWKDNGYTYERRMPQQEISESEEVRNAFYVELYVRAPGIKQPFSHPNSLPKQPQLLRITQCHYSSGRQVRLQTV